MWLGGYFMAGGKTKKSYGASPIKRSRSTKAEMTQFRSDLLDIVSEMQPMTVRQVFYQATVRGFVDKSEAGYNKVQNNLVHMRRSGDLPYEWLYRETLAENNRHDLVEYGMAGDNG